MDEDEIRACLLLNEKTFSDVAPSIGQSERKLRRASVLLPLFLMEGEWHVLFIRRTETVLNHKGQVAFPGGSVEVYDQDAVDTALRESFEEIGLTREHVRVLGRLADFHTITDYLITPVIASIDWPFNPVLSVDEVARVFSIPFAWLANRANWVEQPRILPDGRKESVIFFSPYDGELLWGVTARIMLNFLHVLGIRG